MRFWVLCAALAVVSSSLLAQNPVPLGTEFQINTYTTSFQRIPSAAFDGQGNFVVVWDSDGSYGTDSDGWSIQAQRYDATGQPLGGQFQVNSYTTGGQFVPHVDSDSDGHFVVVWLSQGSPGTDNDGNSVQAQRFDPSGVPVGGQFQVNSNTPYGQLPSGLSMDAQGNFVVTWQNQRSAYFSDSSIQGQRFDPSGSPQGSEFQVNTYSTFLQKGGSVAMDAQGNFVVVWGSYASSGSDPQESIQARRFDATGAAIGSEFQVNTYTTGRQVYPSVSADSLGDFVVVWDSWSGMGGTDTGRTVVARRFDGMGTPLGGDFQVNSYTTGTQEGSGVAVDSFGNFVVTWYSYGSDETDTSGTSVQAQYYDSDGQPVGQQFQVNSYTTGYNWGASAAMDSLGNFIVTWDNDSGSYGTDSDAMSAQGQRFASPLLILASGFESGDTSAWSSTVP